MSEHGLRHMTRTDSRTSGESGRRGSSRPRAGKKQSCVEGVLITDEGEHPVVCLDMAFSGVRVRACDGFEPELGDMAEIRIPMGNKMLCEDCLVVETTAGPDGTIIHLAM